MAQWASTLCSEIGPDGRRPERTVPARQALLDASRLRIRLVVNPHEIYNLGAQSHVKISVLPALLARIDQAAREGRETVEIWGSGRSRREFLHVDDLADAVVFLLKSWSEEEPINIGTGTDVTIAELARLIADIVGFTGEFVFDPSKPEGTPRKLLDLSKLTALG